ncbi:MAG: bifunctional diguanylate cyclase/phosphodiesterase [Actinomycetota bacterium]|nr:bifunctional diguanylate cyclase/phosphodiesterase [Actinomycetota bacterium]
MDASQWRFRQVIESCPDVFIEIDGECAITEWNAEAERQFGWTRDELIGRSIFAIVGDQATDVIEQGVSVLKAMAATETPDSDEMTRVFPSLAVDVWHKDGRMLSTTGMVFATQVDTELRLGGFFKTTERSEGPVHHILDRDRLHDQLTGLPNRTLFMRRLGVALDDLGDATGSVAVVVIDLDRFKAINDALGHDAGDDVLVTVASRLRLAGGAVRPMLCRLGGDEFLALFEHAATRAGEFAEDFADAALAAVEEPIDAGGNEIFLTASVGIASTDSALYDASQLVSNADAAMHEAKAAGGKGKRLFGEAMRALVIEKMTTEHSLHRALDRRELTLFYQPVVDISGSSTVGVEALIRWQHPEQGLVAPDRFIPVAEESGLIIPIGAWVLEEACNQLRHWRHHGHSDDSGMMEVNLSARQIDHPGIVGTVEDILGATGLPPENLTLEITESALMRDAVAALGVLRALKSIGVSLAIDDFGTGYSSLSYLQRFPLDVLKVDKSFVDELDHDRGAEIVAAVINLAHALGLHVVAEGVESESQLDVLRHLGCDYAQGYLFSRPVPATELAESFLLGA